MEERKRTWGQEFDENTAAAMHKRTQFLRDRLSEACFEERDWIAELARWEGMDRFSARGGNLGFASNMYYAQFRSAKPFDGACIQKEVRQGIYTPPDKYWRLLEADERARARAQYLQERSAMEIETALRAAWRKAGGRG
jgi:hypothetical protein